MRSSTIFLAALPLSTLTNALRYSREHVGFNLNENETAVDPLDYWGEWKGHDFFPSPSNWRMPMHTFFLDRFANGDPANDDINGTQFEKDIMSNQLRYGGDLRGLQDSLDYLQGMGLRTLYIIGSPFLNMPWVSDGYSPLDLTLLDRHFGDIDTWRDVIADIHRRGMYIILDNTFATMGDLLGFKDHLNKSTPFDPKEYDGVWKSGRRYHDFVQSDDYLDHCDYPRFWDSTGNLVTNTTDYFVGCRDSEFDQYGEVASFGPYQEYERQLSKFAFVQDRLREWRPSVLSKLEVFSCLTIAMLDIDGFRIDKALQVTLDAQGEWSNYIRRCARRFNKNNFYIPGEIVAGNALGTTYIGRGMQPEMAVENLTEIVTTTNETTRPYIREWENSALDGAAFHYSIYRALTRFLGMDGTFAAEGDPEVNFVESWNWLLQTNDMTNANTGEFDPRHMFGVTNHDVFRWPGIQNGTQKNLLGLYIITLLFPGIPSLVWGEEQAMYVLESTNSNYVFGRQPMTSSLAWQLHGCYIVGSVKYASFPIDASLYGCEDDNVSLDHRDPSHPVRNVIKRMFELREVYPVLNDGYYLQQLSNHTYNIYLPGSNNTPTETGLWSVYRSGFSGLQNFTGIGQEGQSVWLLYTNENDTVDYNFDCKEKTSLVAPFAGGTTVKNLFAPYEEYDLTSGSVELGIDGSTEPNGCIQDLSMPAWGFKALVPKESFVSSHPVITSMEPGHDMRILSTVTSGERIPIRVEFSEEMDCASISDGLKVSSKVGEIGEEGSAALDASSVQCSSITGQSSTFVGQPTSSFAFEADLINVRNGIHRISINNVSSSDGKSTNAVDHFLFRVGGFHNPMVFPKFANYSRSLLSEENGRLRVSHSAPGADLWRYTLDFGTTFSDWQPYSGGNSTLAPREWSGTDKQAWKGQHVMVQYWTRLGASSDHFQHGDLDSDFSSRRFPNLWLEGPFNQHGYDAGVSNQLKLHSDGIWKINFMNEWPTQVSVSAWGVNPDGEPDVTRIFGDINGDHILDRIPPVSLLTNMINLTDSPPSPHLAYRLELNDGSFHYDLVPVGSRWIQLAVYLLLGIVPIFTASFAIFIFVKSFYQVKFNEYGAAEAPTFLPIGLFRKFQRISRSSSVRKAPILEKMAARVFAHSAPINVASPAVSLPLADNSSGSQRGDLGGNVLQADAGAPNRRRVLIATMEYDIEDWSIKIKIGGLGVMAQLMSKNLGHQDLIWVVPCVGDVVYPQVEEEIAEPMHIVVLGETYTVQTRVHILRNVTYVLLDAPVFRQQSKAEPYPPRMDDLDSAIYYSAWNSCIAEAIRRFKPDLYHINDYHGAVAPIHLLPDTIPCAISLHNAEFQGLWPMRTKDEREEVCKIYNLDPDVVQTYVQFGEVFNLLHAGVSYLRIHQKGFGAVGVSKKYGKRSWTRYPIFWGLKNIGALPNPDPTDVAAFNPADAKQALSDVKIDSQFESERGALRVQAQKWAGLHVNPKAELFVFVGRWSMQKGVDLIADIFPTILEKHPDSQLITIGPVIDLFGKFAAVKLEKMMEIYPGRVFSKPEFTALPPYIFSGAEFALIPSRDEPFGLVAVEFGRKGALGVGARVGGLGSMPGWWYTIESTSTKHLLQQFKEAIEAALESAHDVRALLRARSSRQRFPVVQWVEDLDILQSTAIKKHERYGARTRKFTLLPGIGGGSGASTPIYSRSRPTSQAPSTRTSRVPSRAPSASGRPGSSPGLPQHGLQALREMGRREGPGHVTAERPRDASSNLPSDMSRDVESEPCSEDEDLERPWARSRASSMDHPEASFFASSRSGRLDGPAIGLALSHDDQIYPPQSARLTPPLQSSKRDSKISFTRGSNQPEGQSFLTPRPVFPSKRDSTLSFASVVGDKTDFELQKTNPFFTDPKQDYTRAFEKKLANLNAKNTYDTCIEDFIEKSEKDWFNRFREVKLGKPSTPASSVFRFKGDSPPGSIFQSDNIEDVNDDDQFLLERNYQPPTGIKKFLLRRIGDWPVYSLLLAFGQIIAANSYQITLLVGQVGQPASKLYAVATTYLITSVVWWFIYRRFKAVYALSVPFVFYGFAFLLIGLAPFVGNSSGKGWVQNIATGCYATASSSGAMFFALNFGDQGGAPVTSWVFRATVIQGTQQIYISALWWWGSTLARLSSQGVQTASLITTKPAVVTSIGVTVAFFMWAVGMVLFIGLPDYYRQSPGKVPSFLTGLIRRKIVLWFFMMVVIQNFFLSAPYGRNWLYLWSSQHMPTWGIALMVAFFFVGIWAIFLFVFNTLSKKHSWILSLFAIGLGAPRWCQILWSTSNIGLYLPWAGSAVGSTIAGRSLWLWLGVLDSIQGVGFGMILLHTLTRFHIIFTLIAAQVLGSIATIAARGFSPNNLGPGPVFPDFSAGLSDGLRNAWFWVGLFAQLTINVVALFFFRKEQLNKP